MTIDEIKYLLCIEGEYPLYSDLKKRIILRAQREINNYSDLFFKFEEVKLGRKVYAIDFIVRFNDKTSQDTKVDVESEEEDEDEEVQKVVNDFNLKYNGNLDPVLTKNLVQLKGLDCIKECIKEFGNFVSNANEIEKVFYDFARKYGTDKAYTKPTAYHNSKPIQATNYEQRTYTDEELNDLYDNVTFVK
jgi:plasmid replication initiation protein